MIKFLCAIVLILVSCSSPHDGCTVGTTRCDNNLIMVCNKDTNWIKQDDCKELSALNGILLVCTPPDQYNTVAACLPPPEPVSDVGVE